MDNQNNMSSGFTVRNILLMETEFRRINNVTFGEELKGNMDINTQVGIDGNFINVAETVIVTQSVQDEVQVSIKVTMVGVFEKIGDSIIADLEEFGRVNGAAILFPYIREHVTSLSLKAGLGPIILPPINFANQPQAK